MSKSKENFDRNCFNSVTVFRQHCGEWTNVSSDSWGISLKTDTLFAIKTFKALLENPPQVTIVGSQVEQFLHRFLK